MSRLPWDSASGAIVSPRAFATFRLNEQTRTPNARFQPLLEAGAERTLEAVGCTPLILIEAPSPAYHRGMLRAGDYHSRVRRRPQALRYEATPIVLW
jgi:hypothetical protein